MPIDEPWSRVVKVCEQQHGALSRRQANELGFDRRRVANRVRSGALSEQVPGVLVLVGTRRTFRQRLAIATLAGGGTVASHRAAALLHGFDGFEAAPVEVTVRRGRFPAIEGVVVHRATPLDERDLVVVDGLTTTTVARTLCDLGAVVSQDEVERGLDSALRGGASERWIRETLARVRRPGPTGNPTLERVLSDPRRAGGLPANWFERLLRRAVEAPDLPAIVLQYEVRSSDGVVARFDAAIPEWRIGLEAHSAQWHDRPGRIWRDLERDNTVKALGWAVVYVTWTLAQRPDDVLDLVRRTHAARLAS